MANVIEHLEEPVIADETTEGVTSHETTAASDEGLLASLGLNGQQFISQLFNFALVIAIVWFLILRPLTKKLDERRKIIDESLDKAKEVETNLLMSEQKFNEKIQEAKNESNILIQKAHDEAEKMGNDMKEKTKKELADLIEKAKKSVAAEKEEMKVEIKKETAELVVLVVEKLLNQKLDGKSDEKFIQDILKSVK